MRGRGYGLEAGSENDSKQFPVEFERGACHEVFGADVLDVEIHSVKGCRVYGITRTDLKIHDVHDILQGFVGDEGLCPVDFDGIKGERGEVLFAHAEDNVTIFSAVEIMYGGIAFFDDGNVPAVISRGGNQGDFAKRVFALVENDDMGVVHHFDHCRFVQKIVCPALLSPVVFVRSRTCVVIIKDRTTGALGIDFVNPRLFPVQDVYVMILIDANAAWEIEAHVNEFLVSKSIATDGVDNEWTCHLH